MAIRLCGVGDNVIDRYPASGEVFAGGNAVNVAIFAAEHGADASYCGVVSTDPAGELVMETLAAAGVSTRLVHRTDLPNAVSTIVIDEAGNREFVNPVPPQAIFVPKAADLDGLEDFDVVHVGPYSRLEQWVQQLADRTSVSFDFGARLTDRTTMLLPSLQVATFSAPDMTDSETEALVRWAASSGPHIVLATRGARGAVGLVDGRLVHCPTAADVIPVDTTGAGDAFIGTVLARMPTADALPEVLVEASHAAAVVCTRRGAVGSPRPLTDAGSTDTASVLTAGAANGR